MKSTFLWSRKVFEKCSVLPIVAVFFSFFSLFFLLHQKNIKDAELEMFFFYYKKQEVVYQSRGEHQRKW